jgi:transposase
MKGTLIGIDLAKNIFQICGVNQVGKAVFNRQVRRQKLLQSLQRYPDATIAMEACSGSNYWGRELKRLGFKVMLIPPQHVKPFVKGNKNDRNDAFAICEAARRPHITTVEPRSLSQTDTMVVHRLRERKIGMRTAVINQIRGLLNEYGVVVAQGKTRLQTELPYLLEDAENGLTPMARHYLQQAFREWQFLDQSIAELDRDIAIQVKQDDQASRLLKIRGVGHMIASATSALAGRGECYRNGRHFAANLGLVPREHSSGGKQKLGRITRRGNQYLRKLLVQGAWSVIRYAYRSDDRLSRWARQLIDRRGKQIAAVAVANKLARIIWAVSYHQVEYQP